MNSPTPDTPLRPCVHPFRAAVGRHLAIAVFGLGCIAGLLGSVVRPVAAQGSMPGVSPALVAEVERVLGRGVKEVRKREAVCDLLVRRLRAYGETERARSFAKRIVAIDPLAMNAHLVLAELMEADGREAEATAKAKWILTRAIDDDTRVGALALLGAPADTTLRPMERLPGQLKQVILVPLGPVDVLLLKAVRRNLMRQINFPVKIQTGNIVLPTPDRNPWRAGLATRRRALKDQVDAEELQRLLERHRREPRHLEADEVLIGVYRSWLEAAGDWRAYSDFEAEVADRYRPRWVARNVHQQLADHVGETSRDGLLYLGVSKADLYGGRRGKTVFGWGGKGSGVISYARFLPDMTGEEPNWDKLVERTSKQAVSTAARLFDIAHCGNGRCPVHVVNTVRAHDLKNDAPCARCAARIRKQQ